MGSSRSPVRSACLPLVLLLLGCLGPGEAWGDERFALVIAGGTGWARDRPLPQAETDAERVGAALVELGGFAPDRVQVLNEPDTTTVRVQLRSLAATLKALRGPTLVFFYYLGHADERGLHLRGAPLSAGELAEGLRSLPATFRVGVLDVCHSCTAESRQEVSGPSVSILDEWSARGFMMATLEQVRGGPPRKESLRPAGFTHHFVSGLRGPADADGDGAVVVPEAWSYALQRAPGEDAPVASALEAPQALTSGRELPLGHSGAGQARLVLPRGAPEPYWVTDERELHVVAEARTRPEAQTLLSLKPGRYRVKRLRNAQLEVAELLQEAHRQVEAETLAYTVAPPAAGLLRHTVADAGTRPLWRRREALRLLAEGRAGDALLLFEELLALKSDDPGARRGKARALVYLNALQRRRGPRQEEVSLRAALEAEPWLAEDPDFAPRYERMKRLEMERARAAVIQEAQQKEEASNPRRGSWEVGWGLTLVGSRGLLAPMAVLLANEHLYFYSAINLISVPAVDLGFRLLPSNDVSSFVVGLGGHMPVFLAKLKEKTGFERTLYAPHLHFDAGFQSFTGKGTAFEIGVSFIVARPGAPANGSASSGFTVAPMIDISFWIVSQKQPPPKT